MLWWRPRESNPRRQDPCKGSPQPAAAPKICLAARPGIEPGSFPVNSRTQYTLLARAQRKRLDMVGAPGFKPEPGTLKGCCAVVTPYSRCNCIFAARRSAFLLRPCAPAVLNRAAATSGFRGADFFRFMMAFLALAWCTHSWCRRKVSNLPSPALQAGANPSQLQRQIWGGVRDSNSLGQLGRLEHNPYANPA